jgi:hypothetical protein
MHPETAADYVHLNMPRNTKHKDRPAVSVAYICLYIDMGSLLLPLCTALRHGQAVTVAPTRRHRQVVTVAYYTKPWGGCNHDLLHIDMDSL